MGVKEFLAQKARRSSRTADTYGGGLKMWAKALGVSSPDKVVDDIRSGRLDPYDCIDRFVQHLIDTGRSSSTVRIYFAAVKGLLLYEEVDLKLNRLKNRVVLPPQYDESVDRAPTAEELKGIFLRLNLRGKTLLSVLVSSGMRLGEAASLKIEDIDFTSEPVGVRLRAKITKAKRDRTVYISGESASFLKEYLGDSASRTEEYVFFTGKPLEKPRLGALYNQIMRAVKKAGIYVKMVSDSRRYQIHPHSFRKYFFSQVLASGVERGVAELWMGHKYGLDASYHQLPEEHLKKEYLKAEQRLTILTPPPEVSSDRVHQLEEKILELGDTLDRLRERDLDKPDYKLVEKNDEAGLVQALDEGYEPSSEVNGKIYLRRRKG